MGLDNLPSSCLKWATVTIKIVDSLDLMFISMFLKWILLHSTLPDNLRKNVLFLYMPWKKSLKKKQIQYNIP